MTAAFSSLSRINLLRRLEGDRAIWIIIFLLMLISIITVYSTTGALAMKYQNGNTEHYLIRHVFNLGLGLGFLYLAHRLDYRKLARYTNVLIGLSVAFLVFMFFRSEEDHIHGASRWISIFGWSFQPSDLAKFSLIVYLAKTLTLRQQVLKDFTKGFLPILGTITVFCALIAPFNLSTAILLFSGSLLLMFVAGTSLKYIAALVVIGMIGVTFLLYSGLFRRAETWKHRLEAYAATLTGNYDEDSSYQSIQSWYAISTGGFMGKGVGRSVQRNYIPHPYSDFVYAIILEEFGLVGGVLVLALYLLLLIRGVVIVTVSKTFGALLAAGLSFLLVLQALINMGVTVGVLPVTGLTLPLISMGGTSIIFTALSLGVILSVSRRSYLEQENA